MQLLHQRRAWKVHLLRFRLLVKQVFLYWSQLKHVSRFGEWGIAVELNFSTRKARCKTRKRFFFLHETRLGLQKQRISVVLHTAIAEQIVNELACGEGGRVHGAKCLAVLAGEFVSFS